MNFGIKKMRFMANVLANHFTGSVTGPHNFWILGKDVKYVSLLDFWEYQAQLQRTLEGTDLKRTAQSCPSPSSTMIEHAQYKIVGRGKPTAYERYFFPLSLLISHMVSNESVGPSSTILLSYIKGRGRRQHGLKK